MGLAAGGKQSLLCWTTVMCVMLILFLKHLVCQIVEKNKINLKKIAKISVFEIIAAVSFGVNSINFSLDTFFNLHSKHCNSYFITFLLHTM